MAKRWPSFVTKDLRDTQEDAAELLRRWHLYNKEMRAFISGGEGGQDAGGWPTDDTGGARIDPASDAEPLEGGIRLDTDVVAGFKALGEDWQSRVNEALRAYLRRQSKCM